jgi:UDP-N-acetylmuramate: L-alanyl-gamma-D-glutamyl-meso-diaminopimelate ligase
MRIHFISIGGAVMHNLALELQALGHAVSGSDDEIFEPALGRLQQAGLLPAAFGWFPEKLDSRPDCVILGMHARQDNPELLRAMELGLPVYSFPDYIYRHSEHKQRIAIAGSHGKTSTTAMLMHALWHAGKDFDYLVGAALPGFERMVRLSNAPIMVIEGDEYLSSALDPRPKFLHYKPHVACITGIAWDHINVFPTFPSYVQAFDDFLASCPENARVFTYAGDKALGELTKKHEPLCTPYEGLPFENQAGSTFVLWKGKRWPVGVFGRHNMQNMHAAMLLAEAAGIGQEDFLHSMESFTGTARRLECLHRSENLTVYRDFAHSPSKLRATVEAVREQYPEHLLIAAYELHTYSSLSEAFLPDYQGCMEPADVRFVLLDPHVFALKRLPVLPDAAVAGTFGAEVHHTGASLGNAIRKALQENERPCVLLLMSSGKFDDMSVPALIDETT